MHPLRERECDKFLDPVAPAVLPPPQTPPPPPPIKTKRHPPGWLKPCPPKFMLLPKNFYTMWCGHRKRVQQMTCWVDDRPPPLYPDLYLKPRRLDLYARQLEDNMTVNKELLKRINYIQRCGGFVDCWSPEPDNLINKMMCRDRQMKLDKIRKHNLYFYARLLAARSEQPATKEYDEMWKETKAKLILGAQLPFILFKTDKIDKGFSDPAFVAPEGFKRAKVVLDIWVKGGSKIGKVTVELFNDVVPNTCELFLHLVKGDSDGHAYTGTRFFTIVPGLYCRGGDVVKDNGFGSYIKDDEVTPMLPENFDLKHSVPGVLSMAVTTDREVNGHFNIIFKPLPQFDENNVVFGRIVSGPPVTLERISALGLPLGTPMTDVILQRCSRVTKTGSLLHGQPGTTKFPPRRKNIM